MRDRPVDGVFLRMVSAGSATAHSPLVNPRRIPRQRRERFLCKCIDPGHRLNDLGPMTMSSTLRSLLLSLVGGLSLAVALMPPPVPISQASVISQAQAEGRQGEGGRAVRRKDDVQRQAPRHDRDCHRDVRTHRIMGEMVTHRHVGSNCDVRIVNRSGQPALPDGR